MIDEALVTPGAAADEFEARLTRALGPVVGGSELMQALGYRTPAAFRKALQRDLVPIHTFTLAGRRGRFAATADIAAWLWSQRNRAQ